jgi:hypothetical protein
MMPCGLVTAIIALFSGPDSIKMMEWIDLHGTRGLSAIDTVYPVNLIPAQKRGGRDSRQIATGKSLGRESSTSPQRHDPWMSDIVQIRIRDIYRD